MSKSSGFCLSSTLHVCAQVCWVGTLNTTLKTNHHRGVVKHLFFWCSHRTTNIFKDEDGEKSLNLLKPPARSYHDDIIMTSWSYHDHIILGDHHLDILWPCQDLLNEASSDSDLAGLYQGQLFSRGFHGDTTRFDEVIVILERWIWPTGRFDHNGDVEKNMKKHKGVSTWRGICSLNQQTSTNINKHQQTSTNINKHQQTSTNINKHQQTSTNMNM